MSKILPRSVIVYGQASYVMTRISNSKTMSSGLTPVENAIKEKLLSGLQPTHLKVINESHMHNVPRGSETHFKVVVVSNKFDELPLIKRHRLVNDILKCELQNGVHALSIDAKTPTQWNNSEHPIEPSPNCRGGFGK